MSYPASKFDFYTCATLDNFMQTTTETAMELHANVIELELYWE